MAIKNSWRRAAAFILIFGLGAVFSSPVSAQSPSAAVEREFERATRLHQTGDPIWRFWPHTRPEWMCAQILVRRTPP